jgi:hypothetical protein
MNEESIVQTLGAHVSQGERTQVVVTKVSRPPHAQTQPVHCHGAGIRLARQLRKLITDHVPPRLRQAW